MAGDQNRQALIRQASKASDDSNRAPKVTKIVAADGVKEPPAVAAEAADPKELQVYWRMTGNAICTLPVTHGVRVGDLKTCIHQRSGVPVEEQRLFADGQEEELAVDADASGYPVVMLVRSQSDPRVSDLGHFRPSTARFEPLASGNFTVVRKLAQGINGDIFRYKWRKESEMDVTVKKLRVSMMEKQLDTERDERNAHLGHARAPEAEDSLTEIGVLSYLAAQPDLPAYLLRMLGVYSSGQFSWLVTEFCDGGELFEVAAAGSLQEAQVRVYAWQTMQAVAYLHKHRISHRDISLENILLKDGVVRLMDFGMAVKSHTTSGTPIRFFRAVGKNYYRAPECYVPAVKEVVVTAPAASSPGDIVLAKPSGGYLCEVKLPLEAVPGKPCRAEVWGYAAPNADIFAVSVCLFILLTGNPPFGKAKLADALFSYIYSNGDRGIEQLMQSWGKVLPSSDLMTLMVSMMKTEPSKRPSAEECLASPWFQAMADTPVALHEFGPPVAATPEVAATPQGEASPLLGA